MKSPESSVSLGPMKIQKSFEWTGRLRFDQADPSGWMFFGNAFQLMHVAYEDFVLSLGFEWDFWFKNPEWAVPVRATEAEYLSVVKPGQPLNIHIQVLKVGQSSFQLAAAIYQGSSEPACRLKSTHAFLDKRTGQKQDLPLLVRNKLEALL